MYKHYWFAIDKVLEIQLWKTLQLPVLLIVITFKLSYIRELDDILPSTR